MSAIGTLRTLSSVLSTAETMTPSQPANASFAMCVQLIPDIPWIFGNLLGVPGTGRKVSFESVDAMRVVNGRITEALGRRKLLLGHAAAWRGHDRQHREPLVDGLRNRRIITQE